MNHRKAIAVVTLALGLNTMLGCATPFSKELLSRPILTTSKAPQGPVSLPARESAEACLAVAQTLAKEGHDADAIAQFERARQYDPKHRGISHRLAILYDRTGDMKRAATEFQLAIKEDPKNADLLNDLGYFHYNRGRWAEAEQYFRQTLAIKADHAKAWNNLGLTLAHQERYPESLEAFGRVVSPSEAKANLAFILTTRGKRDEAKVLYRQVLADEADSKIARAALEKLESAGAKKTSPSAPQTIAVEPKPESHEVIPVPPRG